MVNDTEERDEDEPMTHRSEKMNGAPHSAKRMRLSPEMTQSFKAGTPVRIGSRTGFVDYTNGQTFLQVDFYLNIHKIYTRGTAYKNLHNYTGRIGTTL